MRTGCILRKLVVGYIPLPLGIACPLSVDGKLYPIPMATPEGTLVASTSQGCEALDLGGGVTTVPTRDPMTRGPAIDEPRDEELLKDLTSKLTAHVSFISLLLNAQNYGRSHVSDQTTLVHPTHSTNAVSSLRSDLTPP
jgi:hydroxymethylglutaryl-CoA reductase